MVVTPRACSYCTHVYANPCDGKDETCSNKKFIDGIPPGVQPQREEEPPKKKRVPLKRK
jgi:hypothetical protein